MTHLNDRDRLYNSLDRHNRVKIRVPFNPLLLAVLGQYNPLKPEDKPDLAKVEALREALKAFGIYLP